MSAFIVGKKHIDALLTFANKHRSHFGQFGDSDNTDDLTKVGNILLAENYRSVNFRYRESEPYENDYVFDFYPRTVTPVEALKGCSCFDYQACETEDYEESDAALIIRGIRDTAIRLLPGYSDAQGWEFR